MLEKILELERTLFLQINNAHSPFADQFMWLYSGVSPWIPTVIGLVFVLFYTNRTRWKEILLMVATIIFVIVLCDRFASGLCKPLFTRFRPTHHPDFLNDVKTVFGYRGGRYGFISSHAANGFGFAMVTSLIFKNKTYTVILFLWATMSAYSRIYLGVHFISDIIPGILTGIFFGWVGYCLFVQIYKKSFANINQTTDYQLSFPVQAKRTAPNGLVPVLTLLLSTVVIMAIISLLYACQLIPAIEFT